MKPAAVLALIIALPAFAADPRGDHPDTPPGAPAEERAKFHLPPGFEIQLVAAEPEIQKPINLSFDAAGRLWVTGSESYPWPAGTDAEGKPIPNFAKAYDDIAGAFGARGKAPAPSATARDTIRVLSDFDETGRAKKVSIFADGLNIPSGVQPLPRKPGAKGDTVIVYSIPNIYRLEDTDGDGKADKREVLYGTAGFLDTHGGMSSFLYWIDGWIYGTHGFRNHSEIRDKSGRVTVLDSGNTYRFRPDGSTFEIYTHGQTNPFGLTVDPLGNFYSADSHSKPVYMLLRGAYYEGIAKQHDGLGFAPRITDDDHGSTAIAGIACYADDKFPEEYRGNLFNGNVVTQRINRDKLERHGSTPRAIRQPDFLTSDDPWFRPVQVKLGPDGALYIADFYNPIIGHYEFPLADSRRDHTHGRIWRIVWRGEKSAPVPPMPDLSRSGSHELARALADSNLIVRTLAANELVDRLGSSAVRDLERAYYSDIPIARPHPEVANWALERLGKLRSHDPGRDSEAIGMMAILAASPRISPAEEKGLREIVRGAAEKNPDIRRGAAQALGTHPSPENIAPLISAFQDAASDDAEFRHTLRMALRDNLVAPGGYAEAMKLAAADPTAAEKIADVSLGARTPEAAEFLLDHLDRMPLAAPHAAEYLRHAGLHIAPERLPALAALLAPEGHAGARLAGLTLPQRLALADGFAQAVRQRGLALPGEAAEWIPLVMIDALGTTDEALLKRAIETVREARLDAKLEPLGRIAFDLKRTGPIRAAALEAMANLDASADNLVRALQDTSSATLRKRAAELLSQRAAEVARAPLLAALPSAPSDLATVIAAGLAKDDESCELLLAAVEAGKAAPALLRNTVVAAALEKREQPLRDRATVLTQDLPPEDARLDGVIAKRVEAFRAAQANAGHGAQVFAQQCAVCHRLKNAGANIGPALDGIGARGLNRLCEDILDPNRNVDPIFRQTIVETEDGQTLAGLNARTEGDLLTLTDATGKAVAVPASKVKSQTQSRLSLMPATFEQTIPPGDFNDLLAHLLEAAN
jgi:putative heme-binding domain-containing protein